ncbi:MAG: response regulator transcription factor [Salinibacter sp.]
MKLILLVEDDEDLARTIEKGVTRDEDYRVHRVSDAGEALEKARNHRYDLLIVDWILPEMEGPELIRALREEGYAAPILMLTVRDNVEDRVAGLESGADDYLTKPFSFDELRARIRALLRRPGEWTEIDESFVGSLKINVATREAEIGGTPLGLRKKEFDLLRLLAERAPEVVSRSAITDALDVTVSGLRKKMNAVQGEEPDVWLKTVRGVGYRLQVREEEAV